MAEGVCEEMASSTNPVQTGDEVFSLNEESQVVLGENGPFIPRPCTGFPPEVPLDLKKSTGRTLEIQWEDYWKEDVDGYNVHYIKTAGDEFTRVVQIEKLRSIAVIKGLKPNTEYEVTVYAVRSGSTKRIVGKDTFKTKVSSLPQSKSKSLKIDWKSLQRSEGSSRKQTLSKVSSSLQSKSTSHEIDWKSLQRSEGSSRKQTPSKGDEMVELREGLFYNKKTPLRKGGHVYKGEQRNGEGMKNTLLAIKIFEIKDLAQSEQYCQVVNDILELQSNQECKYLAQLECCGKMEPPSSYIAMRLCHRITLADIDLEKIIPDQGRNIFLQICHGLAFLHSTKEKRKPIAHRNLKPSNVLFSIGGQNVMLSDFGLSKVVDETIIKKSSSTQGWRAAEHERGDPDLIKADIFSLGLLGIYILYDKHHPFADPDNKTDPALWQANIMKLEPPNLEPLKDDHLARDLFGKMLSHVPFERPSIEEVLQHPMFWSPTKKITFLRDMYGSLEKKMVKTEKKEHEAALRLACKPLSTVKADSKPVTDTPSDKVKNVALMENVSADTKVLNEMREVIGECWLDRVKEMDKIQGTAVYEKSRHRSRAYYENSLSELLRYIRNTLEHRQNRKRDPIKYWVEAFPKLIPYLLKIMRPVLTPEDRKEYIEEWAEAGDIDVGHLL